MRDAVENGPRNANVGNQTVKEIRQEFADNGKRAELVPEIPVRGKQVTQTKPRDEGNLGTAPRDQGGKER